MEGSDVAAQKPLADQKLSAEVNKLSAENNKVRESAWRTPAVLISIGTLLLSIVANVAQYAQSQSTAVNVNRQQTLAESRWSDEREKLHAELESLKSKTQNSKADRAAIQSELETLRQTISRLDSEIEFNHRALVVRRLEIKSARGDRAASARQSVEFLEQEQRARVANRSDAVSRRTELERRLNS